MESWLAVRARGVDPVEEEGVEVGVQVQRAPEALEEVHRPAAGIGDSRLPRPSLEPGEERPQEEVSDLPAALGVVGEEEADRVGEGEDPLAHRRAGNDPIEQPRGGVGHPPSPAGGAKAPLMLIRLGPKAPARRAGGHRSVAISADAVQVRGLIPEETASCRAYLEGSRRPDCGLPVRAGLRGLPMRPRPTSRCVPRSQPDRHEPLFLQEKARRESFLQEKQWTLATPLAGTPQSRKARSSLSTNGRSPDRRFCCQRQ